MAEGSSSAQERVFKDTLVVVSILFTHLVIQTVVYLQYHNRSSVI